MIGLRSLRATKYLLSLLMVLTFPQASLANEFMKEGMAEYAAGDFADASGHFGGALSTDFNNPVLHYYLGSCYVHMKQIDAAVREFRIAYALAPDKEVGRFAKQALETYGFDPAGAVDKKPAALAPLPTQPTANMAPPKPKSMLEQQAEDLRNLRTEQSRASSEDAAKQGERFVQNKTNDLLDANRYVTRGGRVVQPRLTADDNKSIDSLRKLYDAQKSSYLEAGARQNAEIQNTAASLQDQMNEQAKAGRCICLHLARTYTSAITK